MLTTHMIVSMLAWPAVAAIAVVALAWVPSVSRSRAGPMIGPVAIAVGFAVGYWVVVGRPELSPPLDAKARLPLVGAIGLVLAAIVHWVERRALVWVAIAVGSLVAMRLVLAAAIEFQWSTGEAVLRVAALAAGMSALVIAADGLARRLPARTAGLGLAAIGGLAAPLMLFSDSLLMAQLHGVLGVAAVVTAAAMWLAPERIAPPAVGTAVIALAWSHWVIALLFASMPVVSFVLLATSAPAALTVSWAVERWRPQRQALAGLVVLGVLVFGSVAVGGWRYARTAEASDQAAASGGDDYGYGYDSR